MSLGRESIYSSFFNLLKSQLIAPTGPFFFGSRRYRPPGQLGQAQYPAFFLTEVGEDYDRSVLYAPANVKLFAHITIQTINGNDPNAITATEINDMADAVEDAVSAAATETGQNILNGKVQEAWINGRQAQVIASISARYSEQVMGVEIVLPKIT
ncbi:MAG: hypothetical protein KGL39_26680 [Patescibacteria group bacterium]|nr:hypothetical protein [Patescibacteria group bacterium]